MGDDEFFLVNSEAVQEAAVGMNAFSFGVVFKLLVHDCLSSDSNSIPDIPAEIARIVGVSEAEILSIREDMEWFFSVNNGFLMPHQNYLLKGDSDGKN